MITFARKKLLFGAVIALATAFLINTGHYLGLFEELELKTFDIRARYFSSNKHHSENVAVILIDETSLHAMNPIVGRWPWPRSVHADIIDFLALSGAKGVVFDILFTENERIPGAPPGTIGHNDRMLVEATNRAGNVYHAAQIIIDIEDEYSKVFLNKPLPDDFIKLFSVKAEGVAKTTHNNYYIPFPELYRETKGIGVVEFISDRDGIYRRTKLLRHYRGSFYPILSLSPLLDLLKPESIREEKGRLILSGLKPAIQGDFPETLIIPLQADSSYLINMYGDFKSYSMSGVLASIQKVKMGELEGLFVSPEEFKDKIVFIGASAVGIEDLKPTSVENRTPGVYLHASILSNVLKMDFLKPSSPLLTSSLVLVFSLATAFLILWVRGIRYQISIPFSLAFIYAAASLWLFRHNIVYDMVAPLLSIIFSWMGSFAYLSFTEGKDKRKIKKILGQYVSPMILAAVVDRSAEDVLKAEVGIRERLTILFSDIRGFTSISEAYEAERVVDILNNYFSGMVDVIFEHEGTIDKFIGDAMMVFWGAPVKVGDHGKRAVDAAIDMLRQLEAFNQWLKAKGFSPMAIGIGINTGDVILGNIGSEKKLDYTVIGDNVNLASRTEGLTKVYGCPILITETTYEEVKDVIPCRIVDIVTVVGKKKWIRIFEPMKGDGSIERIIALSKEGFNYYLKREWERAKEMYSEILSIKPEDNLSKIFIKRCEEYMIEGPPPDWDGIYMMKKK